MSPNRPKKKFCNIRNAEFFFENVKDYLDFIKIAKEAIFDGDRVFYYSCW
jgi:hypothetical protein